MSGLFDHFRKKVFSSVWKDAPDQQQGVEFNDKIALGVLMWEVAQADDKFLPEEKAEILRVLRESGAMSEDEARVVMASVEHAARERIDLYTFTHEVSQGLPYVMKAGLVKQLFRVACLDHDLAYEEEEMIRKISGLFGVDHKDFIAAKIEVKKEFGLDTAGL